MFILFCLKVTVNHFFYIFLYILKIGNITSIKRDKIVIFNGSK
jgi:hypothetical protein